MTGESMQKRESPADRTEAAAVAAWEREFEELKARLALRFARCAPRRRVAAYLRGLLGAADRKNGWQRAEAVGDRTPDGLQRGSWSGGVQRRYGGTAGRIENGQMGVFLADASPHGQAFPDRERYLPESWAADAARRRACPRRWRSRPSRHWRRRCRCGG